MNSIENITKVFNNAGADKVEILFQTHFPGDNKPDIESIQESMKSKGFHKMDVGELTRIEGDNTKPACWNLLSRLKCPRAKPVDDWHPSIQWGIFVGFASTVYGSYQILKHYDYFSRSIAVEPLHGCFSAMVGALGGYLWWLNNKFQKSIRPLDLGDFILFGGVVGLTFPLILKSLDISGLNNRR